MLYYVWSVDDTDESYAFIDEFGDEINRNCWKLDKGISCSDWFPSFPEIQIGELGGIKIPDYVENRFDFLIISQKLKEVLEEKSAALFEFFPVNILDKKGRSIGKPYFIANLLDTVDCVDMDASEYQMGSLVKDQVSDFSLLVLDEEKWLLQKQYFD